MFKEKCISSVKGVKVFLGDKAVFFWDKERKEFGGKKLVENQTWYFTIVENK